MGQVRLSFTSEEPEERALADLDLNESEKEDYITSQAGDILLHINEAALGESEKMGSDEDAESRYDSNDINVGEPHEKQGVGEEDNPGCGKHFRRDGKHRLNIQCWRKTGRERPDQQHALNSTETMKHVKSTASVNLMMKKKERTCRRYRTEYGIRRRRSGRP